MSDAYKIIDHTYDAVVVGAGGSGANRAALLYQCRFEIAEPGRRIVPPGAPPRKPHPGADQGHTRNRGGR